MKERPILFSGPMVRAILDGRKTQTRRPYNPKAGFPREDGEVTPTTADAWTDYGPCPLGQPGDRLWVRETWCAWNTTLENVECEELDCDIASMQEQGVTQSHITYKADPDRYANCWRPSIHMPRWASRITLEIVRVRVERVGEITRGDAMAEGCPFPNMAKGPDPSGWFADAWQSIYGTWDANPWVWAVEFRRTK